MKKGKGIKTAGLLLLLLLLLLVTVGAGCTGKQKKADEGPESITTEVKEETDIPDEMVSEQMADHILENMTLEQKVGQLFIVCTDSLDFNAETAITDEAAGKLSMYQPGGVIFFSFNLKDREQTSAFIEDMQSYSIIPMFMAVDEEGGRVSRIAGTKGMDTTAFPPMAQIGATRDPSQAAKVGATIGSELHELGFNLDFAPVADITTNQTNKEIGDRSFGSEAELVADMVSAMVTALQKQGVCGTLKHFPGQGDSDEDTHRGYVNLETSIERLRDVEFVPFEAGIEAGADLVMVSHVAVSSITQNEVPASLSSLMVTDILRGELQFDHVIITDAMNMKVITKFYDPAQAALMAVRAGNDVILMPDDFLAARDGILEAVQDGDLSEEKIDDAVRRILIVKIRRGIIPADSELLK